MRLLWVDPDVKKYLRAYVEKILEEVSSLEILYASTPEEATEKLKTQKVDVLMMEMILYSSEVNFDQTHVRDRAKNGVSLLRKLRQGNFEPVNNKNLPVIVCTTFLIFLNVSDGKNTGRDFIDVQRDILLEKPAGLREVVNAVRTALERAV